MPSDTDPAELEQQHQRDANKLQRRSKEFAQEVEDVGQDWHTKRSDESVPGAQPHADEDEGGEEEGSESAQTEASSGEPEEEYGDGDRSSKDDGDGGDNESESSEDDGDG